MVGVLGVWCGKLESGETMYVEYAMELNVKAVP